MHEIDRVFTKYPFFGSRQIAAYLPQSGFSAGRHRVRRLMGVMGLQAVYKGPNTSKKHPQHRIYPYQLRGLAITRPNQVWCSNITYMPVKRGFLYLVAIMDWATRKVLSWRLSNTLDASFCVEALDEAIVRYGKSEIMDTDQGSQYTGAGWITTLTKAILKAAQLAGYRNAPVYIRGSQHVPMSVEAVRECMPVFFELLRAESNPAVRVVLGHFIFVFIHPFVDGNGRTARF